MSKITDRINAAMRHRNMTASALADRVKITRSAMSQILSGTTKAPHPKNIFKIADALDYEARYLATGKGPKTKEEAAKDSLDLSGLTTESKAAIHAVADSLRIQSTTKAS